MAAVAAVGAWFSVLATGRVPEGLYGLIGWAVRYGAQAHGYFLLLTERYPYTGPDGRGHPAVEPPAAPEQPETSGHRPGAARRAYSSGSSSRLTSSAGAECVSAPTLM